MNEDEQQREDPQQETDEILRSILDESEKVGDEIAGYGRDFLEKGQNLSDLARNTKPLIPYLSGSELEDFLDRWNPYFTDAVELADELKTVDTSALVSSTGTASVYSSNVFEVESFISRVPKDKSNDIEATLSGLHSTISRSADADYVIALMTQLGLDRPTAEGKSSPVDRYTVAYRAHSRPVTDDPVPAATSLIPLRESIDGAIDLLLRRRPIQSNVERSSANDKRWSKIVAVGKQLVLNGVPKNIIHSWASDCVDIFQRDLHGSKDDSMDRDEWERRFTRATHFLGAFLGGLDPGKLSS